MDDAFMSKNVHVQISDSSEKRRESDLNKWHGPKPADRVNNILECCNGLWPFL